MATRKKAAAAPPPEPAAVGEDALSWEQPNRQCLGLDPVDANIDPEPPTPPTPTLTAVDPTAATADTQTDYTLTGTDLDSDGYTGVEFDAGGSPVGASAVEKVSATQAVVSVSLPAGTYTVALVDGDSAKVASLADAVTVTEETPAE